MKVRRISVSFFGLSFLFLSAATGFPADKLRVGTAIKGNPNFFLPLMAAQERGLWAEQGIEGEWVPFDSSIAMASAAVARAIDMGVHTVSGLILVVSRKVPVIGVAKLADTPPLYIWVRSDSPIKEAKDLKDIKMGVARMGDQVTAYTVALRKQLGRAAEIRLIAVGGVPQMIAALRSGAVNAVILTFLTMARMEHEGLARAVVDVGKYSPRRHDTMSVYARKALIQETPDLAKRGLTGVVRGGRYANDDPAWTVTRLMREMGWPEGLAKKVSAVLRFSRDGVQDPKGIEALRDFMVEYDLLAAGSAPRLEELYNSMLVPIS